MTIFLALIVMQNPKPLYVKHDRNHVSYQGRDFRVVRSRGKRGWEFWLVVDGKRFRRVYEKSLRK